MEKLFLFTHVKKVSQNLKKIKIPLATREQQQQEKTTTTTT